MIKIIVTIDSARGLNGGWNLPSVEAYQTKKASTTHLQAISEPFSDESGIPAFFDENRNVWLLNSPKLYTQALPYVDQLLITQLNGLFGCEDCFPRFEDKFVLIKRGRIHNENGIDYQHQLWVNKSLAKSEDVRDADTREINAQPLLT